MNRYILIFLIVIFSCNTTKTLTSSVNTNMQKQPKLISLYHGKSGDMDAFEMGNYVVRSANELKRFSRLYNLPEKKVDFDREMVIVAVDALHNTGGYGIKVTSISSKNNILEVTVVKSEPKPTDMVTMAFAQPFHFIKTQKTDKEIIFKEL